MRAVWVPRVSVCLLTIVGVGALAVPQAQAATAGLASVTSSTVVQYGAGSSAANAVVVTRSGRTVTIDDRYSVRAGKGCTAVKGDSTKVRCTTSKTPNQVRVFTYDGNDTIVNNSDLPLTANGGPGSDRITGGPANDWLQGDVLGAAGAGGDALWGLGGSDMLLGAGGDDAISGGDGNDHLNFVNGGNPLIDWGQGNDRLYGGNGDDHMVGGFGNDSLYGGPGYDNLDAGVGRDRLEGGSGNDSLDSGPGVEPDVVLGGPDRDSTSYGTRTRAVTADLDGQSGDDGEAGEHDTLGADVEWIFGGDGDDVLIGNAAPNDIWGGPGDDLIRGGGGNDTLAALGGGRDRVYGEGGDDYLLSWDDGNEEVQAAGADVVDGGANGAEGDLCDYDTFDAATACERINN